MELSYFLIALCALPSIEALPIPSTTSSSLTAALAPYPQAPPTHTSKSTTTPLTFTSWLPWSPETIRSDLKPFPVPSNPPSDDSNDGARISSSSPPCSSPQPVSFSFSHNFLVSVSSLRTSLYAASQSSFWKRKQYFVPSTSSTSPQNQDHHQHYRYRTPRESPLTLMLWLFLSLNTLVLAWRMRQCRLRARCAETLLEQRMELEMGLKSPAKIVITHVDTQCDTEPVVSKETEGR